MNEKKVEYKVFNTADMLNEIILSEIKKNIFKKRFNLSGEFSNDDGIEIYSIVTFVMFKPNLGPLVKLNLKCSNSNRNELESNLELKRVNGFTYYAQYWFILIFTAITLIVSIYQIIVNGFEKSEMLFLPIFGIIYFLVIIFIASFSTDNLISKVEEIMKTEQIKYKKL